jgi:hypothetical protein
MLMIVGGSNSLIVKTKLDHPIQSIISETPNLQVQQLEYLVGLETTQHLVISTTLLDLVETITMLNPKKKGKC